MAFYIPSFVWNWLLGKGFNVFFKKGLEDWGWCLSINFNKKRANVKSRKV